MRLDSSGNLGLGVTPSAWTRKAIQIGDAASGYFVSNVRTGLGANIFFQSGNKYIESRSALLYSQDADAGVHAWYNAAAGTAGNAITFTQAMTLDASGNLGIGTTSPTALLDVNSNTVRVRTARTPASAAAAGNAGDICWDANYIYVCTATNTWKRVAIATW
jgi:hypothetical protein